MNVIVSPLKTTDQLTSLTQYLRGHPNSRVAQTLCDDFNYVFEYGTEPPAEASVPQLKQQLQQQLQQRGAGGGGAGVAPSVATRSGVAGAPCAHAFVATVLGKIVGFALVVDVEDLHRLVANFEVER